METTCIRRANSYWTTCRCPDCIIDDRRKRKLDRCGAYRRVPASAAWDVVEDLVGRGWTGAAIASAAGLSHRTIERPVETYRATGYRMKFGPITSEMIVNHGPPTEGQVGALPARRRLQGAAHQGWDLRSLSARSGIGHSTLASIRSGYTERISAAYDARIRATIDAIGMEVGPSTQSRQNAARKGWRALLAWDDIDNDRRPKPPPLYDPPREDEPVDPAVVHRLLAGEAVPSSRTEKEEAMRQWLAAGKSERSLCLMHGWKTSRYTTRQETAA